MQEDLSSKIISKNVENIQKLFDITTRVDEKLSQFQNNNKNLEEKIKENKENISDLVTKISIIQTQEQNILNVLSQLEVVKNEISNCDKKITKLENEHGASNERWRNITSFVIQLIWVILAAYLLTKLNLQAPAIP